LRTVSPFILASKGQLVMSPTSIGFCRFRRKDPPRLTCPHPGKKFQMVVVV
jgi:hypothetical protein